MAYKPLVDDGRNIGNTPGDDGKGRIHVKVSNKTGEPVPTSDQASIALLQIIASLLENEFISGQIEQPEDKSYTLDLYAIDERTIDTLAIKTASGTCVATIEIDGVPVGGLDEIPVSSTESIESATGFNTVGIGQTTTLSISGSVEASDLVFTLKYQRTS